MEQHRHRICVTSEDFPLFLVALRMYYVGMSIWIYFEKSQPAIVGILFEGLWEKLKLGKVESGIPYEAILKFYETKMLIFVWNNYYDVSVFYEDRHKKSI